MADENTEKKAERKEKAEKPLDAGRFADKFAEYCKAPSEEVRAKIMQENTDLMRQGILLARRLNREPLPLYAKITDRLSENAAYDKIRMVKDGILAGVAGWVGWKGIVYVYRYFRPV